MHIENSNQLLGLDKAQKHFKKRLKSIDFNCGDGLLSMANLFEIGPSGTEKPNCLSKAFTYGDGLLPRGNFSGHGAK